jgi:hypothetical protein
MKYILLFLFSTTVNASNFFPAEAELLNDHAHLIQLNSSYFQASGYFDELGIATSLPVGNSFSMINTDFKIIYGISKKLEASVMARLRSVASLDGTNSLSKTGPESAGIKIKYGFPMINKVKTAVGFRYRQTLYTNTKYDPPQIAPKTDLVLGDDGSEYVIDFYSSTLMNSSVKLVCNLSYVSPPNNLSNEIQYKLEGQYLFTSLSLLGGIDGVWSRKNDPFTTITKPQISAGATHSFNSINRAFIAPYIGMNYAFKNFGVGLLAQTVAKGTSTDGGNLIALNLSTGTEGVTAESTKTESFKEYHVDGSVLKISPRGNYIRIDQGLSSDVEKGMNFDIYQTDYFGGNLLVASGVVIEVGSDTSTIKLTKKYKEVEIKPGFAARGY